MRDASGDFRAFAQGFGPVLYRVGYLLAGDAEVARDLVDASLARTWRRWRDVESGEVPELVALQALVRRFVRSRRTTGPAPRELGARPRAH